MRSRASLVLMELLVMVLVFALAAAMCLRVFGAAEELSAETARRDRAVILAQNAAERLKTGLEPEEITGDLTLTILETESDLPGLKEAKITVWYGDEALFTLATGFQEVAQ